jgi:hypothetical protein
MRRNFKHKKETKAFKPSLTIKLNASSYWDSCLIKFKRRILVLFFFIGMIYGINAANNE